MTLQQWAFSFHGRIGRKMAHDGRLQDISGTEMLKATTRYKESMFSFLNFSDDD